MSRGKFRWQTPPSKIGVKLQGAASKIEPAVRVLAATHGARAEGKMKGSAPWSDQTGFARRSLYGRSQGTSIHIGTHNTEYGLFLELGTIYMAARPVIAPVYIDTAIAYWTDTIMLVRSLLSG